MTNGTATRVLLGPQSPARNIAEAVTRAELPAGPLAIISAGWQEAEGDVNEVAELIGRDLEDLALYRRSEQLLHAFDDLAAATRHRQDRLMRQQRLYRRRLKQLSIAARQTLLAEGDSDMIAAEQRHAIAQLRALDRHHLHRCEAEWKRFAASCSNATNATLDEHAAEIRTTIERTAGVVITGGNVVVLINRLRLFGVDRMLAGRNVVAWSAGAMALADRIVLFHERAPEGRRDPEVLGAGCGLIPGFVFLPSSKHRLRLGDRCRLGLMSRRFAPAQCVTLDNGAELQLVDGRVQHAGAVRHLGRNGRLKVVRAA